jgi:hydroxypyruvate reductase
MNEATLREHAAAIFRAALEAADPIKAVLRFLDASKAATAKHVWVIGAGKASAQMAVAVERVFGDRIAGGLINVKDGHTAPLARIELNECGHPVPDARGVEGARRIAEIARGAGEGDLVVCVISGGASALLPAPAVPVTLEDKQAVTKLLLNCGATIHEINAVRKHLSELKGGRLARLAAPARVLSLLLSDVIGDNLDVIGSGPTAPDASTFAEAYEVLERYRIWNSVPRVVRERIESGMKGEVEDTPKTLEGVENIVVGSNRLAVRAAAEKARQLGLAPLVLSTYVEGETRDVARVHAAIAKQVRESGEPVAPPCCVISGGETTVTIHGDGLGGRSQEFALQAAMDIAGMPNVVMMSGGTDGTDGPTDAAGAICDGATMRRAGQAGLDANAALKRNDSYHFFDALGDLIRTGPTGTNVMDVRLVLVG